MSQSNDSGVNLDHLDVGYVKRKIAVIVRDLTHYTAQEMARELVRLAKTVDEKEAAKEAGRAALANQPAPTVPAGLPDILREASKILSGEKKLRAPIVDELDGFAYMLDAHQPAQEQAEPRPELTVWLGEMPESNGKTNYTAMLKRKDAGPFDTNYMTIARSEYPDRVRYEADCVRFLIGESSVDPCILDYDSEKHSGYVKPAQAAQQEPAAAPQQAAAPGKECDACNGRGQVSYETSGSAEDGNAPVMEPCPECAYGQDSAPGTPEAPNGGVR